MATNAVALNGVDQYGTIATYTALDGLQNYTVEFWIYQDSDCQARASVFMLANGTSDFASYIEGEADPTGINFGHQYSSTSADGYASAGVFDTDAWAHIAVVFTKDQVTKVYKNGVEIGYTLQNTPSGTYEETSGEQVWLGVYPSGFTTRYWKGRIGCTRIWSVARTEAQILDNKDLYLDPTRETGLVANLNFTEGSGTTVNNDVSSANDLSLNGSPSWAEGPTLSNKDYDSQVIVSPSAQVVSCVVVDPTVQLGTTESMSPLTLRWMCPEVLVLAFPTNWSTAAVPSTAWASLTATGKRWR